MAATMFDPPVNPEDLDTADRKIFLISDPTTFLTHAEVCARNPRIIGHATDNWGSTLTREHQGYPVGHAGRQRVPCCSAVEVAVDPDTGEIEVLKLVYITDVGRIIFHEGAYGQAEAGCDHVMAQAIYWDQIWDTSTGYMLNSYFWQSRFPTSMDLPIENYVPELREGDSAVAPYGATGMGEPCAGNHNTVNLAVSNAIGTYIIEGPLNPWTVLKAMGKV
jgi:CO/xanthine dehydrogenase Mo-binding subunit